MRWFAALLVTLLVVGSATGVGVGQQADQHQRTDVPREVGVPSVEQVETPNGSTPNGTESEQIRETGTTIHISLQQTGDARWDVTARFPLQSDNETAAFRQLASEYENGETDTGFSPETFERVAERTTADRDMEIRGANRSGQLLENGTLGTLTLTFTWTNFSSTDGDQLHLGDAFETESGTWLPELSDGQTLILEGPSNYFITRAPAGHNDNQIRYEGPREFDPDDFRVTFTLANPEPNTTPGDVNGGEFPNISGVPGLVVLLLVVAGGAGAYAWRRRDDRDVTEVPDAAVDTPPARPSAETDASADPPDDDADGADDETDVELLSDEERVLRLLRSNDGRMKQADIVNETNWSNAKVSQLLSKMDDSDDVNKLRIGRENLITLPDEDVTDME
ncbi:helix-turn-helix transcriptional regulator [Halorussus amylolyticus]|uniref:helix-turn-helix transcriptional regulator n=1 Tax=Halorussus amylolyticus TaxID=1126242 RepID=UPI001045340B|nr:hypothetical protein [Halorussus amylolyticus]